MDCSTVSRDVESEIEQTIVEPWYWPFVQRCPTHSRDT